jgi:hypothetical protein
MHHTKDRPAAPVHDSEIHRQRTFSTPAEHYEVSQCMHGPYYPAPFPFGDGCAELCCVVLHFRAMKGYIPVVQVLLHSIYSRHGCNSLSCAKLKAPLWEQTELFLDIFCKDNEVNKKKIVPALPMLVKGVTLKFPGYSTLIRVSYLLSGINEFGLTELSYSMDTDNRDGFTRYQPLLYEHRL